MKIAIGCSMKYRDIVRDTVGRLEKLGFVPLFPNLDYSHENSDKADSMEEKHRLALAHYAAIEEADIYYLIDPEGHIGTSCKLELGYAVAAKKKICFSETTNDFALDCYVTEFIALNQLENFEKLAK